MGSQQAIAGGGTSTLGGGPGTGSSREIETTVFDPANQFLSNIYGRV